MNGRRNFIKGFGLFGAIVASASVARAAEAANAATGPVANASDASSTCPVDISHLAPVGQTNLTLMADNTPQPQERMKIGSDGSIGIQPSYVYQCADTSTRNNVVMSVGKDNRLWIKVDEQWKRVALEA